LIWKSNCYSFSWEGKKLRLWKKILEHEWKHNELCKERSWKKSDRFIESLHDTNGRFKYRTKNYSIIKLTYLTTLALHFEY
jgi:hypothetical protein